jgi:hypothetical protein
MNIAYLRRYQIDIEKWDSCIEQSDSRLVYAQSWYLDIVSPQWSGLVGDDYMAVMPLPTKKKYGIPYFYQPPFTQQLGLFDTSKVHNDSIIDEFIRKIPFRPYRLHINGCRRPQHNGIEQLNYTLYLGRKYDDISSRFDTNTLRNINKAHKSGVIVERYDSANIVKSDIADKFIEFYLSTPKPYEVPDIDVFTKLIREAYARGRMIFYFAHIDEVPIAALALLWSGKRMIYLCPISSEYGKQCSAMFLIVNQIIVDYQDTGTTLDFEGSRIEGIARFYRGFGAKLEPYFLIKRFI